MTAWQEALLAPRRVAVVGASATPGKVGYLFLYNLTVREAAYTGEVIAIHPTADEILGCPTYPTLPAVPGPIDLAIVVTPPAAVPEVIADCGAARIPVAVVISGGFAETGARGAELQQAAVRAAAVHGVRVIGPNCFGIINTACGFNGSLAIGLPRKGGISLVTQSGAYGMAAYSRSIDDGLGFAKIVALGNRIDVDEADLVEFLGRDPETKVIAVLLESIADGQRLFEAVAQTTKRKPVVILKTGRHPSAQRAAQSHTAALAGDAAIASAALRQAGVHLVDDGLALLDVAATLERQPPLRGRNIGIITNSGGIGVELTDLFESNGLAVPALSPKLQAIIAGALPQHGSAVNPIDVTTDWPRFAAMYGAAIDALMMSDEVDAVVPVLLQRSALMPEVIDAVIAASKRAQQRGSMKPIHVCWVAPREADINRWKLLEARIPCHPWPSATAATIAATIARPARPRPVLSASDVVPSPSSKVEDGWIGASEVFTLLHKVGFPIAAFTLARTASEAAAIADDMTFPVVLKAERPRLVHKSDAKAVRLGLVNRAEVIAAFEDFCRQLGPGPALVQRQVEPGLELMIGARRDPHFGPVVIAGLGGVWVEALNDISLRLAPIDVVEARTMLDELKGRDLLAGYRGSPSVDVGRVAQLIADLSCWFSRARWADELDLNPVIACGDEITIVDARIV